MNDEKCPACRDYLRDCICEECRSCGQPSRPLNTDDMCEVCEEMGEEANEASAVAEVVGVSTSLPAYIAHMSDGTVRIELDLSEFDDDPTSVWVDGEEIFEDPSQLVAHLAVTLDPHARTTFTIGA